MPTKNRMQKGAKGANKAARTHAPMNTPAMQGSKGGAAGMSVTANGWEAQYNDLARRVTDQEKRLNQFSQTMARIGGWFTKLGGGTGNAGP